ncbi:hypothetical protein [Aeromonas dhakensis]|uniref:hypothetical protein n=1 Tax=Aeromonas dhakensis TaxID=196024 RepID=UPI0038B59D2D
MVDMSGKSKTEIAWLWMCEQPQFSIKEVIDGVGINKQQIYRTVSAWVDNGFLKLITPIAKKRERIYQVADTSVSPRLGSGVRQADSKGNERKRTYKKRRNRKKTVQQKIWNTMKISRRFTLADLMITANTNRNTAWHYTNELVRAGYVRLVVHVNPKMSVQDKYGLANIYQLIRDTGRFAPIRRDNGCWDQNQQRLYPFLVEEGEHGNVA